MKKVKIFLTLFFGFLLLFIIADRYLSPSAAVKLIPKISSSSVSSVEYWTKTDHDLFKASSTFFAETLERSRFNGAILVSRGGKIIFEKYAGLTNISEGNSIDTSTSFHLASISKTFTAMAILKLKEMLLLNLDDPVNNYLQGFPYNNITIRYLLNHRSGLPNYVHFVERLGWDTQKNLTNEDLFQLIVNNAKRLSLGKPDSYFDYCNTNYALLALVIEKVSKLSYAEFLKIHFFEPLGMKNSFVFVPGMQEKILPSYKFNNRLEPFMFLDEIYGDKNVYSSVRDLKKWDEALYENQLFKKETLEEAFRGYSYEKKGIRNYGLGWRLIEMPSSKKIIYHNGWWHGNNTVFCRFPNDSTSIIVLGNKYNRSIYQARKIGGIFEGYDVQWDEEN